MFMKSLLSMIAAGGILLAAGTASATIGTYTDPTAYSNFGGQGTMNVNSWAPDSMRFAYVTYEPIS